jgi:hypothetical protein
VLEVGRVYKSAVLVSAKALIRDSLDAPLANGDFMLESCLNHDVGRIRGPLDVFVASLVSLAPLNSFIKGSAKLLVGFQKLRGHFLLNAASAEEAEAQRKAKCGDRAIA